MKFDHLARFFGADRSTTRQSSRHEAARRQQAAVSFALESLESRMLLSTVYSSPVPPLGGSSSTLSQPAAPATITTDRQDYAPGQTVSISGTGFKPLEQVQLEVDHIDGTPNIGPSHDPWVVTAGPVGNVRASWTVGPDDLDTTLQLTATGLTSGKVATHVFTDAGSYTVTASSVNGSTSQISVAPSAAITISMTVENSNSASTHWQSSGWLIATSLGTLNVVNTANNTTNNAFATDSFSVTAPSTPGTYNVYLAGYSSDDTTSRSNPTPTITLANIIKVLKATTTTVSSSNLTTTYGTSVTFTSNVTGTGGTPSGTVAFLDGVTQIGTGTLNGAGQATFATSALSAASHSITAKYLGDTAFGISTSSAITQTVNQASLSVTANNKSKTYGDVNPTLDGTLTGVVAGDGITASYSTAATQFTNVGSPAITATLNDPNSKLGNYNVSNTGGTLTINKANQTISWSTPSAITYGTALSGTQLNATVAGVVGGSAAGALTYSPVSGTVLSAGNGQSLGVTAAATTNYNSASTSVLINVNKASLSVTANNKSKTYGDANPTLDGTLTGVVSGDGITASYSTAATQFTNAGSAAITASLNDPNSKLGNYNVTNTGGTLTINKANQTISWSTPSAITYGTALSGTQLNATVAGVVGGSAAGAALTYSPVSGTVLSAGNGQSLGVTAAATTNYNSASTSVLINVNKASLSVTANSKSKTYGDVNPTLDGTLTGVVAGDGITASYATAATQFTNAGSAAITASLNDPNSKLGNYNVTNTGGTLTINKANQTISWSTPSAITYGTALSGTQLNATVAGVVGGSAAGALTYSPVSGTVLSAGNGQSLGVTAAATTNYNSASTSVLINVNKASLTVSADSTSREYGDANPAFTGTLSGVVNSDNITVSYSSTATASSDVGGYSIVATLSDPDGKLGNYNVSNTDGTLTVTEATLTVSADSTSRTYGDVNPTFTGTLSGIKNSDNITASYSSTATASSDVGDYSITVTLNDPDGKLGNYTVSSTDGTLTIDQASLTVTANDDSREYGDANPSFSGSVTGIKNSDNITASYSSSATASSNVGGYAITATLNDPDGKLGNYDVTYNDGTLSVTKATLLVTANNASRPAGDSNPTFTATITGYKNSENLGTSGVTGSPSLTTLADGGSAPGSYAISAAQGSLAAGNYDFGYAAGTLTVLAARPTVTNFQINDGSAQRSMVKQMTITFDQAITFDAGAFTLVKRGVVGTTTLGGVLSGDHKSVTITFTGTGGSLADGTYDLTVNAGLIHNGDGTTMSANAVSTFHRLFGDINGDRTVDSTDNTAFQASYGKTQGNGAYNNAFDYDNNTTVNNTDLAQFKLRVGTTIPAY